MQRRIVIKVDLHNNKFADRLSDDILKINAVQKVDIHPQANLLVVEGEVDPKMLIDFIKSRGKEASLGSLEDLEKRNNNIHNDGDREARDVAGGMDQCPQYFQETQQNRGKKCYCNGDPNYNKKRRQRDHHVVENFEGPRFQELDKEICNDPYCRFHRRNHGSVPPGYDIPPMYWDHQPPGLGRNGFFPVGRNPPVRPPPFSGEGYLPPPPPPPFGYASSSMPPSPYGDSFYPRRPPFGQGYHGDSYNDERVGGCSTM